MRTTIKYAYEANDGQVFDTEEKCQDHEKLVSEMKDLHAILHPRPHDIDYSNGTGYVQQTPEKVLEFKIALLKIASRYVTIDNSLDPKAINPWGIIGRILDDAAPRQVNDAWYRLMCMDDHSREWGRPFYAKNEGYDKVYNKVGG